MLTEAAGARGGAERGTLAARAGVCDPAYTWRAPAARYGVGLALSVVRGLVLGVREEVLQYVVDGVSADPDALSVRSTPHGEQCRDP